jgi:hypothetical protein
MPTDAERFQFLEQFKLTASWDDEGYTLFWREKSVPWQYGRLYVISKGRTLPEATDAAIDRYNRKHGIVAGDSADQPSGVHWLHLRGWVS